MRTAAAAFGVIFLLAGCSESPSSKVADDASDFGDFDVDADTGLLLGVVVDEAIRPLAEATVTIAGPQGETASQQTDDQGRFVFEDLVPGAYIVNAELLNYASAQTTGNVVAGDEDPPILRVQLARRFTEAAFSEQIKFDGFIACAYAVYVSSTCVNDYTRLVGERCTPSPAPTVCTTQCAGGCLKQYELAKAGGNIREYVTSLQPGWQTLIEEVTWKDSSPDTPVSPDEMGVTISFFGRPDSSHWYASFSGTDPVRGQLFPNEEDSSAQGSTANPSLPTTIPPEGIPDLFLFYGAGDGAKVNQAFTAIQHNFYFGLPPEGWSFVNGDELPF